MGEFLSTVLDIIFVLAIARMIYGALRQLFAPRIKFTARTGRTASRPGPVPPPSNVGEMARDPVCGMFVSTELSHRLRAEGGVLHFCSPECMEKYRRAPRAS